LVGLVGSNQIAQHDPGFSLDAFVSFAEALFLRINRARAAGRLADVSRALDEGVAAEFQAEGRRADRARARIGRADVVSAGRDAERDTVVVRFSASAARGLRRRVSFLEDWTFQRPAVDDQVAAGSQCPVCGAPLTLTAEGACRYCGTPLSAGMGGWRLVRVANLQSVPAPRSGHGCLIAGVVAVLALVVLLPVCVSAVRNVSPQGGVGDLTGGGAPAAPSAPPPGRWTAHVTLSGGVGEVDDGTITVFANTPDAPCRDTAHGLTGLWFQHKGTSGAAGDVSLTAYLPKGVTGPGTYDLASGSPGSGVGLDYGLGTDDPQIWGPQGRGPQEPRPPGKITATLVLNPDGSGTLTATNLLSVYVVRAGDPLGQPLDITMSFSCS
jgi:hypothetical protein